MKKKVIFNSPLLLCSIFLGVIGLAFLTFSCNSTFTPKPTGYFNIPFPEKKYQLFNQPGYPYTFEYPVYGTITKDSTFFEQATENPWWININFPSLSGKIHITYQHIDAKHVFDTLKKQSFELTSKHTSKAYSINDSLIATANQIHGVFFTVGGDVATANQFFLTDSTKHFLRGALYFDAAPNADSLGIVNQFLIEDVKHLINSFKWRNK